MNLIHFSDTHLGFSDLDIVNEENINQREADFYNSFLQIVKQIKVLKPDFILHTGDLFHRANPSNRAITFALEQFHIIDLLNIPLILIAGNHSTPRTIQNTPILKIFENFKNIYISYEQQYKSFKFKNIVFHTIPHINDENQAIKEIEKCEKKIDDKRKNILLLHCSVGSHFLMSEYGEWVFPKEKEHIFESMDYVALGHWHKFGKVKKYQNVYYSGSTERTSLKDKSNSKGFINIELNKDLKVTFKEIDIRKIITKEIDCKDFQKSIKSVSDYDTKDAIVEVKLKNLNILHSIDIQNSDIKKLFKDAMYVDIKREFKIDESENENLQEIEPISLEKMFLEYIKKQKEEHFKRLKPKIKELFLTYEEKYHDTL